MLNNDSEKYQYLIDSLNNAYLCINSDGIILEANKKYLELFNYNLNDIKQKNIKDLDADLFEKIFNVLKNKNEDKNVEFDYFLKNTRDSEQIKIKVYLKYIEKENSFILFFEPITREDKNFVEMKLIESEKKFKSMYSMIRLMCDTVPDMIWAKDLNKNYIFANKALCENLLFAENTDEPIGKNDLFFANRERELHKEFKDWHTFGEICRDSDQVVMDTCKPGQFDEYGNVRGKFLFLDVRKAPLFDENGNLIGTVGSARDVTLERAMQDSLKKSEARNKAFLDANPDMMFLFSEDGIILDYKAESDDMLYVPPQVFLGKKVDEVLPEEIAKLTHEKISKVKTTGLMEKYEYSLDIDGKKYFESRLVPCGENNYLAIVRNVTTEKNMKMELIEEKSRAQENEEKFRGIVDNSPALIILTDSNGIVNFVNGQCKNILGYDESKFLGIAFPDIIYKEDVEKCYRMWEKVVKEYGAINNFEYRIIHKNGDIRWVSHSANWLKVGDKLLGVQNTILDITEIKKAEEELLKAKEIAEESDKLKSAFLANISHEIRTPMNGIIGFANLLLEPNLTENERKEYVKIIDESCKQLLSVISDILDISKLEKSEAKLNIENVNVNDLLNELYFYYKNTITKRDINIFLENLLPNDFSFIETDEQKLKQILNNLLNNAIKFTHKGFVKFGCILKKDYLEFYVKDTGIGIPKEIQNKIFEAFRQGEISYTRNYGGVGLGLSIAKGYTQLLGGEIWLESELSVGTTFYFTIPFTPVYVKELVNIDDYEFINQRKSKILVVEDEAVNFLFIQMVLFKHDYELIHAKNGVEAIELIEKDPDIDLILMDIKMPLMNGYEATEKIRKIKPDIPIIAQTAYALDEDIEKIKNYNFDSYISKPFTQYDILEIVKKHIKK